MIAKTMSNMHVELSSWDNIDVVVNKRWDVLVNPVAKSEYEANSRAYTQRTRQRVRERKSFDNQIDLVLNYSPCLGV